jgi:hypothetical protein
MCPRPTSAGQSGGVSIPGQVGNVAGDIVGGNKITYGLDAEELVAALASAYAVIGTEAAAASSRTFDAASGKPLYGRSADLDALDEALAKHDRGILLLRGEAGLGKSHLAAAWPEPLRATRAAPC